MTDPEMMPVDSSNIASIGYEDDSADLYVEFVSGRRYVYAGVSRATFDELSQADSKGSYLNREIKPNHACSEL